MSALPNFNDDVCWHSFYKLTAFRCILWPEYLESTTNWRLLVEFSDQNPAWPVSRHDKQPMRRQAVAADKPEITKE